MSAWNPFSIFSKLSDISLPVAITNAIAAIIPSIFEHINNVEQRRQEERNAQRQMQIQLEAMRIWHGQAIHSRNVMLVAFIVVFAGFVALYSTLDVLTSRIVLVALCVLLIRATFLQVSVHTIQKGKGT